jgi:hypothetical protein
MTPSFEDAAPDRFDLLYHFSQITPEQAVELEEKSRRFDEEEAAKKAAQDAEKVAAVAE